VIAAARRLRLAVWMAALRLRLRRHGVRAELTVGRNIRFAGRPRVEIDPFGTSGGALRLAIGDHVRVGRDLVIEIRLGQEHVVEIGAGSVLQDHVRLQGRGGAIRLADHVQLRDFCELKSAGQLTLASRAICGRNVTLHCVERVSLGSYVGLAERVTITDSDHGHDGSDRWFMDQPVISAPVVLEDNAFVATNSVVLRGSTLGRNAVVAAGAVVAGLAVPPGHLAGGVPARTLKPLSESD
jgi:acetyltransferase-like isoleucine patch superfamily enzyme